MRISIFLICGLIAGFAAGCMGIKAPAHATGVIWEVEQVDVRPKVIKRGSPYFPGEKRGLVMRGKVTVQFVVTPKGEVADPVVLSSSNDYFTQPAFEALCSWRFKPAMKGGVPVNCRMKLPMTFSIDGRLQSTRSPRERGQAVPRDARLTRR